MVVSQMQRKNWTPEREDFLRKNYRTMKDEELADALALDKYIVQNRLRKLGLSRDKKWSKERIIEEIQKLAMSGEELSAANIRIINSQLYDAASKKNYFGNWGEAVKAAGHNYDQYRLINKHTETSFLLEIQRLQKSDQNLLRRGVVKKAPQLVSYAEKHYGSWNKALKKAGYTNNDIARWEQEEKARKKNLHQQEIKERILSFHRRGVAVNMANIVRIDSTLYRMAKKEFGSWKNVIEFAGLSYADVAASGKEAITKALKKWDKEKVVQEILKLTSQGIPLNATNIKALPVYAAALKYFGSLEAAISACGLDYTTINLRSNEHKWSKETIVENIKKLHRQNVPLSYHSVKTSYPKLLAAACSSYHFGTWKKAVEAAGYVYHDIKKKRDHYTAVEIQKIVKQLHVNGADLSYAGLKGTKYAGMVSAATRMSNGWHNFLSSIGIDYSLVAKKRQPWTKEEIISTIRELVAKENDISFAGLKGSKYMGMVQTARRREFWGSWGKAIAEAGYDYALICKNRNTESERGLALQRLFEEVVKVLGLPIEPQIKGFKFDDDLCIPDFVDIASGCWIDIKISSMSGGIDSTVKKYLKYVDELWIYYLLGPDREWPDKRVHFKSIKDFFAQLKAHGRGDLIENFEEIAAAKVDSVIFDTWAKKWDKQTILSTISERYRKGLPVSASTIQDGQIGLYKAAIRYYGSWPAFIEAAGIEYKDVNDFESWTIESVKSEILKLYKAGDDLSHTGIRKKCPKLLWAATRYFNTWRLAVEACGIDYKQSLRQEQWTKERVLKELKKLVENGADLSYTGMYGANPKLVVAAERHFGSWQSALELLGFNYSNVRRQKKWTPELVVKEIASLISRSEKINVQKHYNALYKAALRYYDSWPRAVELAKQKP